MNRVYISKLLSADLKSRSTVQKLYVLLDKYDAENTIIDFDGVHFATRSFIDEFYNVLIKQMHYKVENMPSDIECILNTVKTTQNKKKYIENSNDVKNFSSVDEFCSYISSLAF